MNAQSLGSLRTGWSAILDDCALSGGWTSEGNEFAVVDAAGGMSVFDGKRGDLIWEKKNVHDGGALATLFTLAKVNLQPRVKMDGL